MTPEEERRSLAAWTLAEHQAQEIPYWCLPSEASRILGISAEAVRRLIYKRPVLPGYTTPTGRVLLRRADVEWAAANAGPAGDRHRWTEVKAGLLPGQTHQPARQRYRIGRPTSKRAREIAELPWPQLVTEYQCGATVRDIASRLQLHTGTVQRYLRAHGAELNVGPRRKQLKLKDDELQNRHAAGATLSQLAAECNVSTSLIGRRVGRT